MVLVRQGPPRRVPAHARDDAARPPPPGAARASPSAATTSTAAASRSRARRSGSAARTAVTGADGVATRRPHPRRPARARGATRPGWSGRSRTTVDGRLMRALLVSLLLVLGRCRGLRAGRGGEQEGGASLLVTRDFGARELGTRRRRPDPRRRDRDAAAAARLRRRDALRRRLRAGDQRHRRRAPGRPARSTGSTTSTASSPRTARPRTRSRRATGCGGTTTTGAPPPDVLAVVGAFPEPFLSGTGGKKLPVRLDCAPSAEEACDEVAERLADGGRQRRPLGGRRASAARACCGSRSGTGARSGATPPCASSRRARRRPACTRGRPPDGRRDRAARRPRASVDAHARAGGGLVAATRLGGEAPTWVVTGTDDVGVAAAAAAVQEGTLRNRFAVAVEAGRPTPLPILPPPATP